MSAFARPTAAPSTAPETLAPQPVAPLPGRPPGYRWWIAAAVVLAIAGLAYLLRPKPQQRPAPSAAIRTAKAVTGTFQVTLRVAGVTAAKNFANIIAPMMRGPDMGRNLVLVSLAKSGSIVKKGELVAQIDTTAAKDHVDDVTAIVEQAEADVRKRSAEQAIEMEDLRQNLRVAKSNLEKAKLDNSAAEIRTDIDREQLKLDLAEAEAQYAQVQKDIQTTAERQRAEIRILELTRERHRRHRDRHAGDLVKFTIRAPIGGLVVMTSVWRGGDMGQVQEGDQVSPGQPFMKIVDVSRMQVEATVNQTESESLRLDQQATVRFDAFPDLVLPGKVRSVGALAVGGWRQNYYIRNIPIKIDMLQTDPRVIPDLSASGDIVLSSMDNALMIPLEALERDGGKHIVHVKQGTEFVRREVEAGPQDNIQAVILSGLSAGEEVALQRPTTIKQ